MHESLWTAGERVDIRCAPQWLAEVMQEGAGGAFEDPGPEASTMSVEVEAARHSFRVGEWEPLMRGAWRQGREVLIENACSSGLDLLVRPARGTVDFVARWHPPVRVRAAAGMRSRFHLLLRAVLLQYPAMWWAGTRGRIPLHASMFRAGTMTPLVAGPSGVGKSTLLATELAAGGRATSDNLCVTDGISGWGVVEPVRLEGKSGRRMPHGRREQPLIGRVPVLTPDRVVLLRRGTGTMPEVGPCDPAVASRALIGSTYMAGEMRRYWPFAATVAAGTGLGPAHPPICAVSEALTRRVPCVQVLLSTDPTTRLSSVLDDVGARDEIEWPSRSEVPVAAPHVPAETLARATITSEPAR
jgi:hypothetical protein